MAYQHFYSRVPARMSMYNHVDGYDTFAKSADLSRDFITTELSAVCDYRPSKSESILIFDKKLPTVYCQFFAKKSEELVQSCISYIDKDYTNERIAYMAHSLVMPKDEAKRVISRTDSDIFDTSLFVTDIDQFNLTAVDGVPDAEKKEIFPENYAFNDIRYLTGENGYKPSVLKRFIFALLLAACGKGKPVYVALKSEPLGVSDEALKLMNAVLQVFPFSVRANISYITYVSDYTKFNAFKVKFLSKETFDVPDSKGYIFDITNSLRADGIRDEEYVANATTVEFFYSLINDESMRLSFLAFCNRAAKKDESLNEPTLKSVSALVFLYRQCCGRFKEAEVLPDDVKVYDLFTVYERYCDALTTDDRIAVFGCLSRYYRLRMPIPQNVFTKFCKLYPKEPEEVKNSAMSIMLEFIHVDIMRDKLFAFIKSNYRTESIDNRAVICKDLCGVFYGGFLQSQIHALFAKYFLSEKETARDEIVGKFLLSIRTPAIQDKILSFFATYYKDLTPSQKEKFFETAYEMIPYCDALTVKLINLIDEVIVDDDARTREAFFEKLIELVFVNQRKKEPLLLGQLTDTDGCCKAAIVREVVLNHSEQKVFDDLLSRFASRGVVAYAKETATILGFSDGNKIVDKLAKRMAVVVKDADLFDLIEGERVLKDTRIAAAEDLAKIYFRPMINEKLLEAFDRNRADGVDRIVKYCAANRYVERSRYYPAVVAFSSLGGFLNDGDARGVATAFSELLKLPEESRAAVAEALKKTTRANEGDCTSDEKTLVAHAAMLILSAMLRGSVDCTDIYEQLFTLESNAMGNKPEYLGKKAKAISFDAAFNAIKATIVALTVIRSCDSVDNAVKDALVANEVEGDVPSCAKAMQLAESRVDGGGKRELKNVVAMVEKSDKDLYLALTAKEKKGRKKFLFFGK